MSIAAMTTKAAKNNKVSRNVIIIVIAVGLVGCCSFSLQRRVARTPLVLLSPWSAIREGEPKTDRTDKASKKQIGFALRQPRSRSDLARDDKRRRSLMAATPRHGEEGAEEEYQTRDEKKDVETQDNGKENEGESFTGGRRKEIDDQAADQATDRETAGGAIVGDGVEVIPPGEMTAASSDPAVPSTAAAGNGVRGKDHKCWVFMHLQKSGGSTVKRMLVTTWKKTFFTYDNEFWKRGDKFTKTFGNKLAHGATRNVMAGGYTAALRRVPAVQDNCQFFILFRHPIARIVSAYFYCKVATHDSSCASDVVQATNVDLLTFAKHWGNYAVRQMALSFVPSDNVRAYIRTPKARQLNKNVNLERTSGWFQLKAYLERPLTEAEIREASQTQRANQESISGGRMYHMLQQAQNLIKDGYTVGILEEWNSTLALYDRALGIPGMDWKKQYVEQGSMNINTKFAQAKARMLEKAWTDLELKKYLQLDLLLYEHAVDVFHEQARSHGVLH